MQRTPLLLAAASLAASVCSGLVVAPVLAHAEGSQVVSEARVDARADLSQQHRSVDTPRIGAATVALTQQTAESSADKSSLGVDVFDVDPTRFAEQVLPVPVIGDQTIVPGDSFWGSVGIRNVSSQNVTLYARIEVLDENLNPLDSWADDVRVTLENGESQRVTALRGAGVESWLPTDVSGGETKMVRIGVEFPWGATSGNASIAGSQHVRFGVRVSADSVPVPSSSSVTSVPATSAVASESTAASSAAVFAQPEDKGVLGRLASTGVSRTVVVLAGAFLAMGVALVAVVRRRREATTSEEARV